MPSLGASVSPAPKAIGSPLTQPTSAVAPTTEGNRRTYGTPNPVPYIPPAPLPPSGAASTPPVTQQMTAPLPQTPVGYGATEYPSGSNSSPQAALNRFLSNIGSNPAGYTQYGPYLGLGPGINTAAQLQYLLADPYNRNITDSAERQSLDATNTAFDAARGRMLGDQLQSGAGESGVARGMSKGLDLARGNAQAANVRDYEKFKVETGDKRLRDLGLQYMASSPWGKGGLPASTDNSDAQKQQQYQDVLKIALALMAA